jgi:hypothetical protein
MFVFRKKKHFFLTLFTLYVINNHILYNKNKNETILTVHYRFIPETKTTPYYNLS